MSITALNHITLACSNLDVSFQFYLDVLGFKPLVRWDKGAYFLVGECWFCLNVDDKVKAMPCYTHYAFSISPDDFKTMADKIFALGIPLFKENTSPGDSLYFLDPDGHKLELHVGSWQNRIEAKKKQLGSWKEVKWFI